LENEFLDAVDERDDSCEHLINAIKPYSIVQTRFEHFKMASTQAASNSGNNAFKVRVLKLHELLNTAHEGNRTRRSLWLFERQIL
jgi:hypothetical protein